jgi:hypothetical protein
MTPTCAPNRSSTTLSPAQIHYENLGFTIHRKSSNLVLEEAFHINRVRNCLPQESNEIFVGQQQPLALPEPQTSDNLLELTKYNSGGFFVVKRRCDEG